MDSPLAVQSPKQPGLLSPEFLVDSLSKALRPIVYTPESCRKPKEERHAETIVKQVLCTSSLQDTSNSMVEICEPLQQSGSGDTTYNVTSECDINSTVALYESNGGNTDQPSPDIPEDNFQSASSSSVLQR